MGLFGNAWQRLLVKLFNLMKFERFIMLSIVSISMAMSGMLFSWSTPTLPSLLSNSTETKLVRKSKNFNIVF